jgi:hypothetical protein
MPTATSNPPKPTLTMKLSNMVLTLQFLWFVGHVATILNCALYILYNLTSPTSAGSFYKKAIGASILSYAIVVYKTYSSTKIQFNMQFAARLLMDENIQYFMLAIFFFSSPSALGIEWILSQNC